MKARSRSLLLIIRNKLIPTYDPTLCCHKRTPILHAAPQMIRIRKPRGISTIQLMVVSVVGLIGGIYIWKPLFVNLRREQNDDKASTSVAAVVPTTQAAS